MILRLNTPYNPGDADRGKTYSYVYITGVHFLATTNVLQVDYAHGNLDADDHFVPGAASPQGSLLISGKEFEHATQAQSEADDQVLTGALRLGYSRLQELRDLSGTILGDLPL